MKKTLYFLICILSVLSSKAYSLTLLEAIKASLQGNKKIIATTLRLEAAEENAASARLSWVPSVNLSAGNSLSQSNQGPSSQYRSAGISSSISLYDGGVREQNLIATESDLKAANERFNSTSATGGNTRASIAGEVLATYVSVITLLESQRQNEFSEKTLKLFLSITTVETEKAIIQQQLLGLQKKAVNFEFQLKRLRSQFKNTASIELPPFNQLQNLDDAIRSLEIPMTADAAFKIALEKNPSIRVAEQDVISAEARNRAYKASLGPQVAAQVSVNRGGSGVGSQFNYSTSKNVGVTLSMSLDVQSKHIQNASDKTLAAAKSDRDGIIDDRKFQIDEIYPDLQNQVETFLLDAKALRDAKDKLSAVIEKINLGQPVDLKDEALFSLATYDQYLRATLSERSDILYTKYKIQQVVGTLFENLGVQKLGMSDSVK